MKSHPTRVRGLKSLTRSRNPKISRWCTGSTWRYSPH